MGTGETPAAATGGSIPWAAKGFIIKMPQSAALAAYFRRNDGTTEYQRLLASVLFHELIHFRQYRHPAHSNDASPEKPADEKPETLLRTYYSELREVEAHAAQIAFLLGPSDGGEATTEQNVFYANPVGQRISARLDVLRSGSLSQIYHQFCTRLTDAVAEWRDHLYRNPPPRAVLR